MFTINNKSDYALLMVSHLADRKEFVPLSVLVRETKLPQRFIARIASDLVKHDILESREGKVGGYKISKSLKEITLFEFFKIFEEDLRLVKCQLPGYECNFEVMCGHNNLFRGKLTGILVKELTKWTLQDIIKKI